MEDLKGGDPEMNAGIIRTVLEGQPGAARDIVVVNAAAALFLAQRVPDMKEAVALASETIESGAARRKLEQLIEFTARLKHEVV